MEDLQKICRENRKKNHGSLIKKTLMALAIPATAAFVTACYGAPMPPPEHAEEPPVEQQAEEQQAEESESY